MKSLRTAVAAAVSTVAATLLIAAPASASTTQTDGPFSLHVVGNGLNVQYVWFSEHLGFRESFHGTFWIRIDLPHHRSYQFETHRYDFHNSDLYERTFVTGRYYVRRNFPNHSFGMSGEFKSSPSSQHGVQFTIHR